MTDKATLRRHAELLDRTAARVGVDLEEAAISGRLRFDEISDSVLRCVQCPNPEDCAHWLDRGEVGTQSPPVYCQNSDVLTRLRENEA